MIGFSFVLSIEKVHLLSKSGGFYIRGGKVKKLSNISLIKVVDFFIKFHKKFVSKKTILSWI